MPSREDEFWINQREGLRYCLIHKHYYKLELGCQLCWLDSHKVKDPPILKQCPCCNQASLFWNSGTSVFECLNLKCKHTFSKNDLVEVEREHKQNTRDDDSQREALTSKLPDLDSLPVAENTKSQLIKLFAKCPDCLNYTLLWISPDNVYECQYDKCHNRRFTEQELLEIQKQREAEPKGKGWMGNEYWDGKKRKWRKK